MYEKVMALTEIAPDECLQSKGEGKYMLDLWEVNRRVILHAGVPEENIIVGRVCTCCHSDLLFSHRDNGSKTGRYGSDDGTESIKKLKAVFPINRTKRLIEKAAFLYIGFNLGSE